MMMMMMTMKGLFDEARLGRNTFNMGEGRATTLVVWKTKREPIYVSSMQIFKKDRVSMRL